MPARLRAPILALAVWVLPGCDNGSETPSNPGSFEVTVEGAAAASFSGGTITRVTTTTSAGLPATSIYSFQLVSGTERRIVQISAVPAGQRDLVAGSYAFNLPEDGGEYAIGIVDVGTGTFVSRSGTLTVTRPASERVRGVFAFEAESESGTETVTVRGRFEADIGGATRR